MRRAVCGVVGPRVRRLFASRLTLRLRSREWGNRCVDLNDGTCNDKKAEGRERKERKRIKMDLISSVYGSLARCCLGRCQVLGPISHAPDTKMALTQFLKMPIASLNKNAPSKETVLLNKLVE